METFGAVFDILLTNLVVLRARIFTCDGTPSCSQFCIFQMFESFKHLNANWRIEKEMFDRSNIVIKHRDKDLSQFDFFEQTFDRHLVQYF